MKEGLSSGEVAREADVNVQTLRYYERRKLLSEPVSHSSGRIQVAGRSVRG